MRLPKILLLAILFAVTLQSVAQDEEIKRMQNETARQIKKDTAAPKKDWTTGGSFNLNAAQGSLSNWAAGGDDFSFTLNSYFGVFAFYKKDKWSWDNTLDLNFGYINTTTLGSRKNDDRIDLLSKLGHEISPKVNLATLFNLRTQFAKGYNYVDKDNKELLSDFFSPAYVILSLGIDYKPVDGLSIFVSPLTARWIIVNNDSLSAKGAYGVDSGKTVKNEIGAFASIRYIKELNKVLTYNGKLDLFSNYKKNPQNVDIIMNNVLSGKLAKFLTMTAEVDLIYDDDVKLFGPNNDSPALQLKTLLGLGLTFNF